MIEQLTRQMSLSIKELHSSVGRQMHGAYICEGENLLKELLRSGTRPRLVVVRSDILENQTLDEVASLGVPIFEAGPKLFDQICDAKTPQGIVSVVDIPKPPALVPNRILVLDRISDPGNLGTIVRSARWFGIDGLVFGTGCADIYLPKAVRATMGALFGLLTWRNVDLQSFLDSIPHTVFAGRHYDAHPITSTLFSEPFALLFGSEAHGIDPKLERNIDSYFSIPGSGVESLNVAIAASIAMYEAAKTRRSY